MRVLLALLPVFFLGCEGSGTLLEDDSGDTEITDDTGTDTADTGTDTGDTADTSDTGGGCTATLLDIRPEQDEPNVALDVIVTATFSAPVGAGDWSLSIDGVTGSSALAQGDQVATFTPDADLARNTSYTARVSVCGHQSTVDFDTLGATVPETNLDGRTYAWPRSSLTWVKPAGASLLTNMIQFEYFLFYVEDVTPVVPTITAWSSLGLEDPPSSGTIVQDPCTAPRSFGTHPFTDNPEFEVGPTNFAFDVQGVSVGITGAHIRAVFVDDGAAMESFELSGLLDTRPIDGLLGFDACGALSMLPNADHCVACPDGPVECLQTLIRGDRGEWVQTLTFDTTVDPSQNLACN